jgi:hypothetical protein
LRTSETSSTEENEIEFLCGHNNDFFRIDHFASM